MDLDPRERGPQDACGVFGVWAPGEEVSKLTYFGLYALQHRGQESAGIALSDGARILVYKDMGLVSQVFDEATLYSLRVHLAIGHCRYSTAGSSVCVYAQPTFCSARRLCLALGHNGNLTNAHELTEVLPSPRSETTTDTEVLTNLLAHYAGGDSGATIEDAAMELLPKVEGAFSL